MKSAVSIWRKQKKDKEFLGQSGTVLTWTRIVVAPPAYAHYTPYIVVLVELKNKTRIYGQMVDYDDSDLVIGRHVTAVLRRMGQPGVEDIISYGIKFKPS